jgi:hypothetical protein
LRSVASWLGEVLLGSGAASAHEESDRDEWWKEDASDAGEPTPMVFAAKEARQAKLFDDDGEVSGDLWGAAGGGAVALSPGAATQVEVMGARGRVASRSRGLAVTRARVKEHAATSAEALETARAARGAMTRQLWRSQSISSGRDEPRWLAVPQCGVLLPRYQLFGSADAVEQDRRTGRMTVRGRDMRVIRGRVWFV